MSRAAPGDLPRRPDHSEPLLDLETQFFTQRGIGVVDVNYRGSTGFGAGYRRLLNGRWGEIDWQDCVAAARYLAAEGDADPDQTWVEGGSAGGYVVFCALVFDPTAFAAGVSYFGVADAEALALHTHKFESRYLDSMIGPYPEERDLYRAVRPCTSRTGSSGHASAAGVDDKVVLPSQAEAMVAVLRAQGHSVRVPRVRGRGSRLSQAGEGAALARGDALVYWSGVRLRRSRRARAARATSAR